MPGFFEMRFTHFLQKAGLPVTGFMLHEEFFRAPK